MMKTIFLFLLFIPLQLFSQQEIDIKGAHIYFSGNDNQREKTFNIKFPKRNRSFKKITFILTLRCPNQACDWWDRRGSIKVRKDNQDFEILRFMTPYRVGNSWNFDITNLRPLLIGETQLKIFIDTWVGPGHHQGEGWIVDLKFKFKDGRLDKKPFKIIPVKSFN